MSSNRFTPPVCTPPPDIIPYQQSPPSFPAFSEDSEILRAGYPVLGNTFNVLSSSIAQPQISIAHTPTARFDVLLMQQRGSVSPVSTTAAPPAPPSQPQGSSLPPLPQPSIRLHESLGNESPLTLSDLSANPQNLNRYLSSGERPISRPTELGAGPNPHIPDPTIIVNQQSDPLPGPRTSQPTAPPMAIPPNPPPFPPNLLALPLGRDAIMSYAHHLYQGLGTPSGSNMLSATPVFAPIQDVTSPADQLVPLLTTLNSLYPKHLPTLLLLGSVHYVLGDYVSSLRLNQRILAIDSEYVEAMCNTGAIMKKFDRPILAYDWWWRALQLQPTYWEVTDNLLNMVLDVPHISTDPTLAENTIQCYKKALEICRHIQSRLLTPDGCLSPIVLSSQFHRFQNLFCTSANLACLLNGGPSRDALDDYFCAAELAIRYPFSQLEAERYTFRDLIFAACVTGFSASSYDSPPPVQILRALAGSGSGDIPHFSDPGFDILRAVRNSGNRLADALFYEGFGVLPTLMLRPDEALRLPSLLFPESSGILPVIYDRDKGQSAAPSDNIRQLTHHMTSTILLSLAKRFQDGVFGVDIPVRVGKPLRVSPSLVLLLYYLALALSPSPSLYNNVGVVLSGFSSALRRNVHGNHQALSGQDLAKAYYEMGLHLNPTHPHLLTNYGSLLKDQGRVSEAIHIYMQAIRYQPNLDVALANLASTIKDMGLPWDAIAYYRRAVAANPQLPEATCGLVSSLNAICDWRGRGKAIRETLAIDEEGNIYGDIQSGHDSYQGYIAMIADTCKKQLSHVYTQNVGAIRAARPLDGWLELVESAIGKPLSEDERGRWTAHFSPFYTDFSRPDRCVNEGGFAIRFIEWVHRRLQRRWYLDTYGKALRSEDILDSPSPSSGNHSPFVRPNLPLSIWAPSVPSVLPFHTFTYPFSPRTIRLISHRNALRVSHAALTRSWLPPCIYPPPPPPYRGQLKIGYVSCDFNNHPLAHLMQSVFGYHDRNGFKIYLYATSASDGSPCRGRIEAESDQFLDVSSWSDGDVVQRIVSDGIHILVNLGGYTKGARNEIFAVRPSPIQISLMGFAGTLAAGWCDYILCDVISCPADLSAESVMREDLTSNLYDDLDYGPSVGTTADPEFPTDDWMYTENFIYMPHSFFVTDHKQTSRADEGFTELEREAISNDKIWSDEERRRATMRQSLFPDLPLDVVIFANFNQLYKIDPEIFAAWLRILEFVPRSVLWLLRFPAAGEENLMRTAKAWAGEDVASRLRFTDVAKKDDHIKRCRVADIFLDTAECNAHTIASDVLWSGTPILTWPKHRHKMCSRVAASVAHATGFGGEMVVSSLQEYEERAIFWADSLQHDGTSVSGERELSALKNLRRNLYLNRDRMPLFDTKRWTRNIEKGYQAAWARWVGGSESGDNRSGCIFVHDEDPVLIQAFD